MSMDLDCDSDDQRVLPDFMTQVLKNEPIVMLSDGSPTRAFCYIADAASLMIRVLLAGTPGEAFNVGSDEREISMRDLAQLTAKVGGDVLGRAPIGVEAATSDDGDYLVDNPQRRLADLGKARRHFPDWSTRVSLESGLARTFRHHVQRAAALGRPY